MGQTRTRTNDGQLPLEYLYKHDRVVWGSPTPIGGGLVRDLSVMKRIDPLLSDVCSSARPDQPSPVIAQSDKTAASLERHSASTVCCSVCTINDYRQNGTHCVCFP